MIAKLELDNHVVSTFDVDNVQEAYDRSVEICRDFESGGLLVLDGKGYGEFDFGDGLFCLFFFNLTTRESWPIL